MIARKKSDEAVGLRIPIRFNVHFWAGFCRFPGLATRSSRSTVQTILCVYFVLRKLVCCLHLKWRHAVNLWNLKPTYNFFFFSFGKPLLIKTYSANKRNTRSHFFLSVLVSLELGEGTRSSDLIVLLAFNCFEQTSRWRGSPQASFWSLFCQNDRPRRAYQRRP